MAALIYNAEGPDYPDSMLARKFGREVVNYFSGTCLTCAPNTPNTPNPPPPPPKKRHTDPPPPPGSPLNRVSFLRASHPFLRAALPSARILLLRELSPLSASQSALAWVDYASVSSLIGAPFDLDEPQLIEAYDSRTEIPTLVFLGLDEKVADVFTYARDGVAYIGQPYFALDITPRESYREVAEAIAVAATVPEGLEFRKVRLDLNLAPPDGTSAPPPPLLPRSQVLTNDSCDPGPRPQCPRLERSQPVLRCMWRTHAFRACRSEAGVSAV